MRRAGRENFHHTHTMELTTEEKLERLEAGLAEIGRRLDALETAQREGWAQWAADRERWAADEAAGGVARETVYEEWLARRVGPRPKTERGSIRIICKDGTVKWPRVRVSDEAAVMAEMNAERPGLMPAETRGALVRTPEAELEQWEAAKERWAAADREVLAQYQEEEPVAAANDEEDREFREAMKRLDMCSDGGGAEPSPRGGGRLVWPPPSGLNDDKLLAGYGR